MVATAPINDTAGMTGLEFTHPDAVCEAGSPTVMVAEGDGGRFAYLDFGSFDLVETRDPAVLRGVADVLLAAAHELENVR
jgi:hypothetical protein